MEPEAQTHTQNRNRTRADARRYWALGLLLPLYGLPAMENYYVVLSSNMGDDERTTIIDPARPWCQARQDWRHGIDTVGTYSSR